MLRYLFVIFFIFIHASASINEMRIKAHHKGDTVYVKALIHFYSVTYKEAKARTEDENNARFISHIEANVSNRVVFDVYTSLYFDGQLRFAYISREKNDLLHITTTDNRGKKVFKSRKIKKSGSNTYQKWQDSSITLKNYRKDNPNIWNKTSIKKAIQELYGNKKIVDKSELEQICGVWGMSSLKLSIKTGKDIKSIAVFQDHRLHPTVAVFNTPVNEANNLLLHVSTERDDTFKGGKGNFTIILENTDGTLHQILQKYDIAGYHEYCDGNEVKNEF